MNEMNEVVKVNSLPEKYYADWCIKDCLIGKNYSNVPYKHDISKEIGECCPSYVKSKMTLAMGRIYIQSSQRNLKCWDS